MVAQVDINDGFVGEGQKANPGACTDGQIEDSVRREVCHSLEVPFVDGARGVEGEHHISRVLTACEERKRERVI